MCTKSGLITNQILLFLSALLISGCGENNMFEPVETGTSMVTGAGISAESGVDNGSSVFGTIETGTANSGIANAVTTNADTEYAGTANTGSVNIGTANAGTANAGTANIETANTGTINADASDTGFTDTATADTTTAGIGASNAGATNVATTDTGSVNRIVSNFATIGDANCPALLATGSAASIAGLYEVPSITAFKVYIDIFDNGTATVYNYLPDLYGQESDCYIFVPDQVIFSELGNDMFLSEGYISPDLSCDYFSETVTAIRDVNELRITAADSSDEDMDGDTTELTTEIWPVVSGHSAESFNRCQF